MSIKIKKSGEEPSSAKRSKRHYQLWKLAESLELGDIQYLVTIRKNKLKYEEDPDEIRNLRTDIKILEETYTIKKRQSKND